MKYDSIRSFEKHLKEASPSLFSFLYVVLSKDDFVRKSINGKISEALLANQKNGELGLKIFNGEHHSIEFVLQELETLSFFAERKVILVNHFENLPKTSLEKLLPFISSPTPDTYLILSGSSLNANTLFFKQAEKAGIVLSLPEDKPWEKEKSMQAWAIAYAAENNKKLAAQTGQFLTKHIGSDPATLKQELDKLICYIGSNSEITNNDILTICSKQNHETIWQLGEAIFNRDPVTALSISKGMLEEGTPLIVLLRQIRSQFQTEFQICTLLSQGGTSSDITRQFPNLKGQILERHIRNAQTFGMKKLRECLLIIDASEFKAKNSVPPELLNELLMVQLTS